MKVIADVRFASPCESDHAHLAAAGQSLTNDAGSVRVFAKDDAPERLILEFTLSTEAKS